MKNIPHHITSLLILLSIMSCNDFEDLNTDPTNSTVANPKSLISTVQVRYSGDREVQWRSLTAYHMPIIQMVSDGWTMSRGQVYEQDASYIEYYWKSAYKDINDLQSAINEAKKDSIQSNYVAVARILKVMIFSQLTDTYGDIPYFEAVKGYDEGYIRPAYNAQEDIYADFFKELKEASFQLNNTLELDGDLMYNGDTEKWFKFANSLRLRLAMRLVNVDIDLAKSEAESAVKAGVFTSYSDVAMVNHGEYNVSTDPNLEEIRGNGFSQVQRFSEEIMVACETYIAYLRDNNDPRLTMMFGMYGAYSEDATSNVNYKSTTESSVEITQEYLAKYGKLIGFPPGKFLWDPTDNEGIDWTIHTVEKDGRTVQISKYFKSLQVRRELTRLDMPTIYQSYSEILLWQTEMSLRGWNRNGTDTKSLFSNAVTASIDELQHIYKSEANISGNISQYIDSIWESADEMEVINMQHYVNNFFNGIEGFANWRRSGYPTIVPAVHTKVDPALNGFIPRRIAYPNSEMNYNRENLENHLDNGVNFWGAPMWWDNSTTRGVLIN